MLLICLGLCRLFKYSSVFMDSCLSSSCYTKIPEAGWLKQKYLYHRTIGGEVQYQGARSLVPGKSSVWGSQVAVTHDRERVGEGGRG